ncbi:hexose kinase [Microbacterium sp. NPDC055357]
MIVTLTVNPSLDRTIVLPAPLRPGEVQQALRQREDAGGKGINVARVVAAAGAETLAVLPLADGDPFGSALRASGVPARTVPIDGAARANIAITDPSGQTTKLNLVGAALADADARAIVDATVEATAGARWLVLAGSLPPGVGDDFYVDVIRAVRSAHGDGSPRIAVDTSGPALHAVVASGHPDLIKPNDEELAELASVALPDGDLAATVVDVARTIVPARVRSALVTLGSAGAAYIDADGAWAAAAPRIRVQSTVGAGDSSLAGFLLAESAGADASDALAGAIRYGSAAASLPGTQVPTPADLGDDDIPTTRIP